MNNRIEVITSWKPLTGWQRFKLKLPQRIDVVLWILLIITIALSCVGYLITTYEKVVTMRIHHLPNWQYDLTIVLVIIAVAASSIHYALKDTLNRTKALLDLEGKVVVYSLRLEDKTPGLDYWANAVYESLTSSEPMNAEAAKKFVEGKGLNHVYIILPLGGHGKTSSGASLWLCCWDKIYILKEGWHFAPIEAFWGVKCYSTYIKVSDQTGVSLVMQANDALQLVRECWTEMNDGLTFAELSLKLSKNRIHYRNELSQWKRVSHETGEREQLRSEWHTASIDGLVSLAETLSEMDRFPFQKDAQGIMEAVASVLRAAAPRNDEALARLTKAEERFRSRREKHHRRDSEPRA